MEGKGESVVIYKKEEERQILERGEIKDEIWEKGKKKGIY